MEQMELLRRIIQTLETIEVRGRANLDKMLGCILQLEKLASETDAAEKTEDKAD